MRILTERTYPFSKVGSHSQAFLVLLTSQRSLYLHNNNAKMHFFLESPYHGEPGRRRPRHYWPERFQED